MNYLSSLTQYFMSHETSPDNTIHYPIIIGLATGNPPFKVTQQHALEMAHQAKKCASVRPVLDRIYTNSKIHSRYMAVPDFTPPSLTSSTSTSSSKNQKSSLQNQDSFFTQDGNYDIPLEQRINKYREEALPLVKRISQQAIERAHIRNDEIHKIIVVSSTGFLGPGLDCSLIDELGLRRDVDRSLVGYMGCAAAMNGFRIAMDYTKTHPGKNALMVCVELSSVHTNFKDNINDAIIHAIFSDGAAAAVITAKTPSLIPKGTLAIYDDYSLLTKNTEDGIVLSMTSESISCTLSKHLPKYLTESLNQYVDNFLSRHSNMSRDDIDFWGVHPGGRRILEAAQQSLGLSEEQLSNSWSVLEEYGNMLSPSVMFVMERIFAEQENMIQEGKEGYKYGLAFSFSPGVGIEGIMFRRF
eukprot:gb/GECH01001507.1/.p1 GENE.gb/GECH01001507.1/~~gb/GECH01001507.1/.p1  ORF type:complete len:413 (+),score=127.72 gb/GECH01001507.1/:1-1239(+)